MKKKKPIKFDESVHYNIEGRKRYKRKMFLVLGILVLILLGCAAMFYFGNVKWDPNVGFEPAAYPTEPYQIALIVLGAVISVGALVGTFLYYWFDINKFYRTQLAYQQTDKFKKEKAKVLKQDLTKCSKSTIKWYKKLGYITAQEKRDILEKQKQK